MSRTLNAPRWGLSAALAGAVALALMALLAFGPTPPRADAAFSLTKCQGSPTLGRGASFARDAHQKLFIPRFQGTYCFGSNSKMTYDAAGSGAGRTAVKVRTDTPRFGMTDEAPSQAEVALMNSGMDAKTGEDNKIPTDDGKVHVVPAAVGTVAPLVNFPDSCEAELLSDAFSTVTDAEILATPAKKGLLRVRFPKQLFEEVWAGVASKNNWTEAFPELVADGDCNKPIIRVVRFDESGTSYAFKDELHALNGTRKWLSDFAFVAPGLTRTWPNAAAFGPREDCTKVVNPSDPTGPTIFPSGPGADSTEASSAGPDQLTSGCANGNGPLVTKLTNTDGSIGYSDVSTARTANPSLAVDQTKSTPPDKYWTQMQDGNASPLWQEPTQDPNGYRLDGTPGANCVHTDFKNVPKDTFGDWSKASGVNSPNAFPVCTMTYGLVFDDNADVWGADSQEESEARTVKDYWESLLSDGSQAQLILRDYSELPLPILAIARTGIAQVDFNKGGGNDNEEKTDDGKKDGGTTPPPPPGKPSNAFSLLKKTISSKTGGATFSVKLPGAGKLEVVGTAKAGKKQIKVGRIVLNANKAGTFELKLNPSAAAKQQLNSKGSLKVNLALTFTPTGGDTSSKKDSVTLKLVKKKGK